MNKIFQRRNNDCIKCCIATIFDMSYEEAFDPIGTKDWFRELTDWCKSRGYFPQVIDPGVGCIRYSMEWLIELYQPDRLIGVGPSPRGDYDHAVVVDKDLSILHDPKDPCEQLTEIKYVLGFRKI